MSVLALGLTAVLAAGQGAPAGADCVAGPDAARLLLCQGEEAVARAKSPGEARQRTTLLEAAAQHFRRAADMGAAELRLRALRALAAAYDGAHLDDPARREPVLRELIGLVPLDPRYTFELAALQESQGFADAAEDTLLGARQRHPDEVETFRKLAQFYARRAAALPASPPPQPSSPPPAPGDPDEHGVYRVGGGLPAPPRIGTPEYPREAQEAGIQGGVQAEIVVDAEGRVSDARLVRSVPLLDDAALKAVREWRYEPTLVNGKPVPVRMIVTVNFTLSK